MQINLSEDDIWMITNAISTDLHSNLELTEDYKKDLKLLLEKLSLINYIKFTISPGEKLDYEQIFEKIYNLISFENIVLSKCINVSTDEKNNDVMLYPNPSMDQIHISHMGIEVEQVTLTDISGREVLRDAGTTDITTIATDHLPPGWYVATIWTKDGKRYVEKIVIQ